MARKEAASSFMPRDQCWFIAVATATRRLRMRGISPEFASASGYFRSAVERMDGSSWTQKIFDGAFQELSNGVFTNEIRMKSSRLFEKENERPFPGGNCQGQSRWAMVIAFFWSPERDLAASETKFTFSRSILFGKVQDYWTERGERMTGGQSSGKRERRRMGRKKIHPAGNISTRTDRVNEEKVKRSAIFTV